MEYIKNDYELQQLALSIALEAIEEVKNHGGDHYELIDQAAASSEHAIYTYKAIMLCAHCCTADAEEMLDDNGSERFDCFAHHASVLAEVTIQNAAVQALYDLRSEVTEKEEPAKVERTILLTGAEKDAYIAQRFNKGQAL